MVVGKLVREEVKENKIKMTVTRRETLTPLGPPKCP